MSALEFNNLLDGLIFAQKQEEEPFERLARIMREIAEEDKQRNPHLYESQPREDS